jgi:hypothetical protein
MKRRPPVWMFDASLVAITLAVLALALNAPAQAQEKKPEPPAADAPVAGVPAENPFNAFKQFSAVMNGGIITDKDRKVYRSGKLMRTDFADQYRITDIDLPLTWVVFTKKEPKSCGKFAVADAGTYPFWGMKDFVVHQASGAETSEGKETVDGHVCKVENLIFVNSKVNPPATMEMKVFEAEDLKGFPIKIELHNPMTDRHFTISYTDVSLQTPDPKLFVHPNNCSEDAHKVQMAPKGTAPPTKAAPDTTPSKTTTPPQ